MNKRKLLPRAALVALVLLSVPAAADAPHDQYERFAAESPSVKDAFTKLEWDRRNVVRNVPEDLAESGCSFLTSLPSARLPTVKELLTIVDEEPHNEYEAKIVAKMIDQGAFPDTPVDLPYWTSTPAPGTDMFWTINFADGRMAPMPKTAKANARCVR